MDNIQDFIYNGVNYGDLVKGTLKGQTFYISKWSVENKLKTDNVITVTEEQPVELNTELHVQIDVGRGEVLVHLVDSLDALVTAKVLSKELNKVVKVYSNAAHLAVFENGELQGPIKTLDDFYTNITDEKRQLTRLV